MGGEAYIGGTHPAAALPADRGGSLREITVTGDGRTVEEIGD